jgi:hypothetical protein
MHNKANNPIRLSNKIILKNTDMSFKKYFIELVLLPYYTIGKNIFSRNSFAYKFFILLNTIWIAFLIMVVLVTIVRCFI